MTVPMTDRAALLQQLCEGAGPVAALSPARIAGLAGKLRQSGLGADLKVAFAGNQVVGSLPHCLEVACALDGILATTLVGDYAQEIQEVMLPQSGLRDFRPGLLMLGLSLRNLAPRLHYDFSSLSTAERASEQERILNHVTTWTQAARAATEATLVVANFVAPATPAAGIADLRDEAGETAFYQRLNLGLLERLRGEARTGILDLDRLAGRFGKDRALDPRMALMARIEWSERFQIEIALELRRFVKATLGRTRKCLVLDLDNTLWGGILGEDGVDGLRIRPGCPEGEAFLAFQQAVLALKRRGVLLALNSKNNADEVAAAFRSLPQMPLTLDDFAARQVNWQPKADNLRRIAEELNIGLDSLVFVDDSPVECSLVRSMTPEVLVVELTGDPSGHAERLRRLDCFELLEVTEQDRARHQTYQENRARAQQRQAVGTLDDYLGDLETQVTIRPATTGDLTRVHQLISKTNQFNLTTERMTAGAVEALLDRQRFDLRVVDVADRFGVLGTVGLFLVERREAGPHIRLFLLSCRALGRRIETAMVNALKRDWLGAPDAAPLTTIYVPTEKNRQVADFYDRHGFGLVVDGPDGARHYVLTADACRLDTCSALTITVTE